MQQHDLIQENEWNGVNFEWEMDRDSNEFPYSNVGIMWIFVEIYPKWHEFQENERNGREFQSGLEKFGGSKNDGEDMVIFMSNDGEKRIR